MTETELKEYIASQHQPSLAEKPGMVWQIWEDGELTLQKSGELLWQRSLHCIEAGMPRSVPVSVMPVQEEKHGYAFIASREVGEAIRAKMLEHIHRE